MNNKVITFRSESGDWFEIPSGQYKKEAKAYRDAVKAGDEDTMLKFEEGETG